jgi:pilus assembly protein Flp/PilA
MVRGFFRNEKGQGMVEYGLILFLVSVVAITMLTNVGTRVNAIFQSIWGSLGGS